MIFLKHPTVLELLIRFALPALILICLVIGYFIFGKTFEKCLLNRQVIVLVTLGAFITSFVNIPIYLGAKLILAINFGAVVIPIIIAFTFLHRLVTDTRTGLSILFFTALICMITFALAQVEPVIGIIIGFPLYFIPVLLSVIFALIAFGVRDRFKVVPIAYSISTLGIFIGTDILLLPRVLATNVRIGYLGGQGMVDLIFVTGLYSIAFAFFIIITNVDSMILHQIHKTGATKNNERTDLAPDKIIDLISEKQQYIQAKMRLQKQFPITDAKTLIKSRMIAFLIDIIIQLIVIVILIYLTGLLLGARESLFDPGVILRGTYRLFLIGWAVLIYICYFTLFEWYFGQTPGKMVTRVKVVTITSWSRGQPKQKVKFTREFLSMFTRNVMRLWELVLGFYIISIIMILISGSGQSISDHLSGTIALNWNIVEQRR